MVFPGYQSPPSPPPHLLDLHPVEALLALLLISAAALLRLVADPPRPMRRDHEPPSSDAFVAACLAGATAPGWKDEMLDALLEAQAIRQPRFDAAWTCHPQASAAPAVGIAPGPTVAELRTMARQQGLTQAGSRPIHKARRADLLTALGL